MRKFLVIALMVALLPFAVGCRLGGDFENDANNVVAATSATIVGNVDPSLVIGAGASVRKALGAGLLARCFTAAGAQLGSDGPVNVTTGAFTITGVPIGSFYVVRVITPNGRALLQTVVEAVPVNQTYTLPMITPTTTALAILVIRDQFRHSVAVLQTALAAQITTIAQAIVQVLVSPTTLMLGAGTDVQTLVIAALTTGTLGTTTMPTIAAIDAIVTPLTVTNGTGVLTGVTTGTSTGQSTDTGTGTNTGTAVTVTEVAYNATPMVAGVQTTGVDFTAPSFTVTFNQNLTALPTTFAITATNDTTAGAITFTNTFSNGVTMAFATGVTNKIVVTVAGQTGTKKLTPLTGYTISVGGTANTTVIPAVTYKIKTAAAALASWAPLTGTTYATVVAGTSVAAAATTGAPSAATTKGVRLTFNYPTRKPSLAGTQFAIGGVTANYNTYFQTEQWSADGTYVDILFLTTKSLTAARQYVITLPTEPATFQATNLTALQTSAITFTAAN